MHEIHWKSNHYNNRSQKGSSLEDIYNIGDLFVNEYIDEVYML